MHFEYAGKSSREYGLILANVETSRYASVSGKVQTTNVYHKLDQKNYYIGTSTVDSPMVFDAEVVSEIPLGVETQRAVMKWLFHRNGYKKLFVDMFDDCDCESYELVDGEPRRTYLNCRLLNPEKLEYNGGVVGYKFTIECDSHLAWQEPVSETVSLRGGINVAHSFTIGIDTDGGDYVYPEVVITTGEGEDSIQIINHSDDDARITRFDNIGPGTIITMNPSSGFVTDGFYDRFVNKNFVRFLDGDNNLTVIGDVVSVKFTWQNKRYF